MFISPCDLEKPRSHHILLGSDPRRGISVGGGAFDAPFIGAPTTRSRFRWWWQASQSSFARNDRGIALIKFFLINSIFSPPPEILRFDVFLAVILERSRYAAQRRISRKTSRSRMTVGGRENLPQLCTVHCALCIDFHSIISTFSTTEILFSTTIFTWRKAVSSSKILL